MHVPRIIIGLDFPPNKSSSDDASFLCLGYPPQRTGDIDQHPVCSEPYLHSCPALVWKGHSRRVTVALTLIFPYPHHTLVFPSGCHRRLPAGVLDNFIAPELLASAKRKYGPESMHLPVPCRDTRPCSKTPAPCLSWPSMQHPVRRVNRFSRRGAGNWP